MSDHKYTPNDSYNELLQSYSARGESVHRPAQKGAPEGYRPPQRPVSEGYRPPQRPAAPNRQSRPAQQPQQRTPGISFDRPNNEDVAPRTLNDVRASSPQQRQQRGSAQSTNRQRKHANVSPEKNGSAVDPVVPPKEAVEELKRKKSALKKKKRRAMRFKSNLQSLFLVAIVLVFVFVASMMLRVPIMGCVNDLLAIDRENTEVRVVVQDGMHINDIIDLLADKGLIYSSEFCKLTAQILDYSNEEAYPEGTYDLSPSMGLESMLNTIISSGVKQGTVVVTFPEGYTVDQIVAKLSENNVASSEDLYAVLNGDELIEKYDFLSAIEDRADRYSIFEGYLYPDTYEFYIGDDPQSVIAKFLDNFARRWTSDYDDIASKLGMTVDEIITLASIIEKEANDAQQMPLISSILYNRIHSTSFAYINCDSTGTYLDSIRPNVDSEQRFEYLRGVYDTYVKTGLPVGAICNPGGDSIKAALYPENTDYYYFLHDSSGKIYVARTGAEHEANIREHLNN